MKVILEYFVGAVIVIIDIVKYIYVHLRDSLLIIVSNNRKKNVIYTKLTRVNYFLDTIIILSIFLIVAQFSTVVAIPVVIAFTFWFFSKKEDKSEKDGIQFLIFLSCIIIIAGITIYSNVKTPYTYDKVGTITLVKSDIEETYSDREGNLKTLQHSDIEVNIEGQLQDVEIYSCKTGTYTVYRQKLEPMFIKFLKVDYMAECDNDYEEYKTLK